MKALPPFYDGLQGTLEEAWRMLSAGVTNRNAACHTLTIGTVRSDASPSLRTVVSRDVDVVARTIRFHTDLRSEKISEIKANPNVSILAYDVDAKVQIRLGGLAQINSGDSAVAIKAWGATRPMSRVCYGISPPPGHDISHSSLFQLPDERDVDRLREGYINFAAITVAITSLEWLYLAYSGNRRAHFSWDDSGTLFSKWMVP